MSDKDKRKLVKAGFATPRGGAKGAYQNHVVRSNRVIIPYEGTDGILDANHKTISKVDSSNSKEVAECITPDKSTGGRGGMTSKFAVAQELSKKDVSVYIVDGKKENILLSVVGGENVGTRFVRT